MTKDKIFVRVFSVFFRQADQLCSQGFRHLPDKVSLNRGNKCVILDRAIDVAVLKQSGVSGLVANLEALHEKWKILLVTKVVSSLHKYFIPCIRQNFLLAIIEVL
jgi:hypothetical protein